MAPRLIRRRELWPQVATAAGLLGLLTLCFWLTSLSFGDFRPENPTVTFVLWVLSTGVVIGTLALGFAVFRNLLKLYVERRRNKLGSRIKTKLVLGVLAVSVVPVALHLAFSVTLLNRNFDKWFSQPTVALLQSAETVHRLASAELLQRLERDAERLAATPGGGQRPGGGASPSGSGKPPAAIRGALPNARPGPRRRPTD